MARPQTHLKAVTDHYGKSNASDAIYALLEKGLFAEESRKQAERLTSRGSLLKMNPSVSDAGKCPRQVGFSLLNIEPSNPLTVDSLANFLMGHVAEEALAKLLTAQGATFLQEERVRIPVADTFVSGRSDFSSEGLRIIVGGALLELKTTNSRSMGWLLKKGLQGNADHRRQLNLYLHATQTTDTPSNNGVLLYWIKDPTKGEPVWHAWDVPYDKAQAEADLRSLAALDTLAKAGKLAPIPAEYLKNPNFPCGYCSWQKTCHGGANLEELLTRSIKAAGGVAP